MSTDSISKPMKDTTDLLKSALEKTDESGAIKHAPIIVGLGPDAMISATLLMEAAKNIGTEIIVVTSNEELKDVRKNLGLPCGDIDYPSENSLKELARSIVPSDIHKTEATLLLSDHHLNMKAGVNLTEDYSARGGNRKKGKTKWPRRN